MDRHVTFADAFKHCLKLEVIILNKNKLLNLGGIGLADSILHLPKLQHLALYETRIPNNQVGGSRALKRARMALEQKRQHVKMDIS